MQFIKVLHFAVAAAYFLENFEHTLGADTAEGAFTTGLVLGELEEVTGDIYYAGILIHYNHAA